MTRQVKLKDDTCEELLKLGKMGQTFDDVVKMLLKFYKENKKTSTSNAKKWISGQLTVVDGRMVLIVEKEQAVTKKMWILLELR